MKLFDDETLKAIRNKLLQTSESISVAESVTCGLLQFAMSNTMDTLQFFQGGITVYNPNQKFRQLDVEPKHALAVNCVSERVAIELAQNVRIKFNSEYGIGITGYASPVPESGNKLFAYFAITYQTRVLHSQRIDTEPKEGIGVQLHYVNEVLKTLASVLNEHES
jgi:nicotinamide-nucleotide amidase